MPDFSSNAILLKKIEFGDHDYIISFFTKSKGKISIMAKNAKKSIKRFSGAFDIFCEYYIQCSYPKKKKDGMIILAKSDFEKGFANIREDIFKTAYASFWIELLYFYLEEKKAQSEIYDLLLFSLKELNQDVISKEVLNLLFQIKFMSISGFSPNFEICDRCKTSLDNLGQNNLEQNNLEQNNLEQNNLEQNHLEQNHLGQNNLGQNHLEQKNLEQKKIKFDFKEGIIICNNCFGKSLNFKNSNPKRVHYDMTISKGTLKQLFWINNCDLKKIDRIKFSPSAIKEGSSLLEAFIPFHIGRDFKSLKFLKQIRQKDKD